MSPVTHLFLGWAIANSADLNRRDRAFVTAAGVIPDIDGLGIIAELATRNSANPLTRWSDYHHVLGHNVGFCLLFSLIAFFASGRNIKTALLVFASFHVHLIADVLGARGPDGDQWPIPYLLPFSDVLWLKWEYQWGLNAWPNVVLTILLIGSSIVLAIRRGFSPVELVSKKTDRIVVETLRKRFPQMRSHWTDS